MKIDIQSGIRLMTCWVDYDIRITPDVTLMLADESGWWDVIRVYAGVRII